MINRDALTARVMHIDSRARISGPAEDMSFQLSESIHLPSDASLWITGVNLPVGPNVCSRNDKLYLTERTYEPMPFTPNIEAAGDWTRTGVSDGSGGTLDDTRAWTKLDLRHYVVTGGTGSRNVEFTEWSHGMHVTKFTESLADGTAVAHFEYNRDTLQFDSVGTPGVGWKYEAPDGFLVVGDYPVIAQSATGITTVSHVLQIPTAEYTASTLGEALELALNSKTQVFPLPVSYKCVTTGSELEVKLQYNGSDVRYSYQGLWRETTTSPRRF
jgi:hypothetical protein